MKEKKIRKKFENFKEWAKENKECLKFWGYSSFGALIGVKIMSRQYQGFVDGTRTLMEAAMNSSKENNQE